MSRSTALIARKSIRARFGRLIAIAIAILVGVAFVVGSFVLADSLRKTFDELFTQISENLDLEVRSAIAFEGSATSGENQRDPIPASLADQVAAVDGVATVEPSLFRYAQLVDSDGEAVTTQGAPTFGISWTGPGGLAGLEIKGEGTAPSGAGPGGDRQGVRRSRGLRSRRPDHRADRHGQPRVHDQRPRRAR